MDRMTDSGSVGWAFESPRDHQERQSARLPLLLEIRLMEQIGKTLIIIGIVIVIAGVIIYFAGNKLNWLGHLPGDINIVRENVRIFIPITTMILISGVFSLILYLIRKFF